MGLWAYGLMGLWAYGVMGVFRVESWTFHGEWRVIDLFLKFNRTEQSLLWASVVCFLVGVTVYPIMTWVGYPDALAVQVMIYFLRTGGVVLFLSLGMSMWRYMRPVRVGEEAGEGAWDPAQAPKMPRKLGAESGTVAYEVVLTESGENKISVIKLIREVTGLGLKEAKDLTDVTPSVVKVGMDKEAANALVKRFEEEGARARVNLREGSGV